MNSDGNQPTSKRRTWKRILVRVTLIVFLILFCVAVFMHPQVQFVVGDLLHRGLDIKGTILDKDGLIPVSGARVVLGVTRHIGLWTFIHFVGPPNKYWVCTTNKEGEYDFMQSHDAEQLACHNLCQGWQGNAC